MLNRFFSTCLLGLVIKLNVYHKCVSKAVHSEEGTLPDSMHEVRRIVHNNGEQYYHGGQQSQLNFDKDVKAFLDVRNFLVGYIELRKTIESN